MSTKERYSRSRDFLLFPEDLRDYLSSEQLQEFSIDYKMPDVKHMPRIPAPKHKTNTTRFGTNFPARVTAPLRHIPSVFLKFLKDGNELHLSNIQKNHSSDLRQIRRNLDDLSKSFGINLTPTTDSIDKLKEISLKSYYMESNIISQVLQRCTENWLNLDFSLTALTKSKYTNQQKKIPNYPQYLLMIQYLRAQMGLCQEKDVENVYKYVPTKGDHKYIKLKDNSHIIYKYTTKLNYLLCLSGGFFFIFHEDVSDIFFGPMTYMDYSITYVEVSHNLELIIAIDEYKWLHDIGIFLLDFSKKNIEHNLAVQFMKTYEGLLLNLSDMRDSPLINWQPLLAMIDELIVIDKKVNDIEYADELPLLVFLKKIKFYPKQSTLCSLMKCCSELDGNQLQESSSLHKFLHYAEVDSKKGIEKFLKRVHTKRIIADNAMDEIMSYANREFITNYIKKHKSVPTFLNESSKTLLIKTSHKTGNLRRLEQLPLLWWCELQPYNCIDSTITDSPLEHAKDKGALKNNIQYGPGDSERELYQVLTETNYELRPLNLTDFSIRPKPEVITTTSTDTLTYQKYPIRLIEKEREQKIEARLYGNGEMKNKHSLSRYTLRTKKILKYFDGELMTVDDKTRKLKIHKMAQMLMNPSYYSLQLDIEGHNQSMQEDNTQRLIEWIGLLFGEQNWGYLCNLFGCSEIYHYDEYEDDVTISRGQLGGIEGWCNQLWTLHTVIVTGLLQDLTSMDLKDKAIYSDDVNIIIDMNDLTQKGLTITFNKIQSHYFRYGMLCKISQTTLSKTRVTMLRQHYYKGVRSDSTLKRLLAVTAYDNGVINSDELETDAVCSTTSSALEMTEHVYTCCFFKWYYSAVINLRNFCALFDQERENSILDKQTLPPLLQSLLYPKSEDLNLFIEIKSGKVMQEIKTDITRLQQILKGYSLQATSNFYIRELINNNIYNRIAIKKKDIIIRMLIDNDYLRNMFFLLLTSPKSLGGAGVNFLVTDILSGHSDGFFKQVYYLHQSIKYFDGDKSIYYEFISNSLNDTVDENRKPKESDILSRHWNKNTFVYTVDEYLKSKIKAFMRKTSTNKEIKELLSYEEFEEAFKEKIIDLTRESYHGRLAEFYYENSVYNLIDLLVNKVETSSGFLKKIKNLDKIRAQCMRRTLMNRMQLFSRTGINYGIIDPSTCILSYLIKKRGKIYNKIIFSDIEEPLYDHMMFESTFKDSILTVRRSTGQTFKSGYKNYKPPLFGAEAMYKGQFIDDNKMFSNLIELLTAKLVAVTQWITIKSSVIEMSPLDIDNLNVIKLCNLSLLTLTTKKYQELRPFSPIVLGGEILHRIPNMKFNKSCTIRSLPNSSIKYYAELNDYTISRYELQDSNIHYDYLRYRFLLAAVMLQKYTTQAPWKIEYHMKLSDTIIDIRGYGAYLTTKTVHLNVIPFEVKRQTPIAFYRFRQLTMNWLTEENMTEVSTLIPSLSDDQWRQTNELILVKASIQYYQDCAREGLTIGIKYDNIETWLPFLNSIKSRDVYYTPYSDPELFEIIKDLLTVKYPQRLWRNLNNNAGIEYNLLIEELKNEIPGMEQLLSGFRNKLKMIQRRYQDRKKEKAKSLLQGDLIIDFQKEFISRNYLVKNILYHMIIDYTLEIDLDENRMYVNKERTRENSGEFLSNPYLYIPDDSPDILLIESIGLETILIYYERNSHILINKLSELFEKLNHTSFFQTELVLDLKRNPKEYDPSIVPIELKGIKYDSYDIQLSTLMEVDMCQKLVTYIRRISALYSDPVTFWSPTGSDSYVAQYGLFKLLLDKGYISKEDSMCDICAGRGDGYLAAKNLGINVLSYTMEDIFTLNNQSKEIVTKDDFNIYDTRTLEFATKYDWIHVDISNVKKNVDNIQSTISYFIDQNISMSVRFNNISADFELIQDTLMRHDVNIQLAYPVSGTILPYQIYLIILANKVQANQIELTPLTDPVCKSLIKTYTKIVNRANVATYPYRELPNSISVLFSQKSDLWEFTIKLWQDHTTIEEFQLYGTLLSLYNLRDDIYLPCGTLPTWFLRKYKRRLKMEQKLTAGVYCNSSVADFGYCNNALKDMRSRTLEDLQSPTTDLWKFEFTFDNNDILTDISKFHPLKQIRTFLFKYMQLSGYGYNPYTMTQPELIRLSSDESQLDHITMNTRPKLIREAFLLLAWSAYKNNYCAGINYLWTQMGSSTESRFKYLQVLEYYRKLSGYYEELEYTKTNSRKLREIMEDIQNKLIVRNITKRLKTTPKDPKELNTIPDIPPDKEINIDWEIFAQHLMESIDLGSSNIVDDSYFLEREIHTNPNHDIRPTIDTVVTAVSNLDFTNLISQMKARLSQITDEELRIILDLDNFVPDPDDEY
jgi:hypothetical protein